jgi:hypothetical protein
MVVGAWGEASHLMVAKMQEETEGDRKGVG